MRNVFVIGTAVLTMAGAQALAQSQGQQQNPPQTNRPASGQPDTARPGQTDSDRQGQKPGAQGTTQRADQQFAMDAAHINMAEVQMGNLAKEKASSERVKEYGDRLVTDHSKALDELKGIAQRKNITLPTTIDAKHKATHDKLSKLSGAAFDRQFAQEMVNGHKEALQKARTAAKSGSDPELKAFAAKMETSVQEHLKIAQSLAGGAVGTSGTPRDQNQGDRNQGTDRNPGGDRNQGGSTPNPGAGNQPERRPQ